VPVSTICLQTTRGDLKTCPSSEISGLRRRSAYCGYPKARTTGTRLAQWIHTSFDELDNLGKGRVGASALQRYGVDMLDPNLSWSDLGWLVREAQMPVWVKGIVRGDDAARAIDHGATAIVVSNHGARQLDGTIAPLDALPEIVASVRNRVPIVLDSGVRRGDDCVKALALGATAVMVGRPILWGLAVDGQHGVENVLSTMNDEISLTMSLLGARTVSEITQDRVVAREGCKYPFSQRNSKL
jgi:isopentenyl diphosphate isomerase/L-lactate dehydrogenase-like FMN-dependent dehydrogenase